MLKKNLLYYPGCITNFFLKHIKSNYKKILKKIGVDFVTLDSKKIFFCCGEPLLNAGFKEDFANFSKENSEKFEMLNVKTILTNCPNCVRMFEKEYGIKAIHIVELLIDRHKIFKKHDGEKIAYFESCGMRKIGVKAENFLKNLGFVVEKVSDCCGAGGNLKYNSPKLAKSIAKELLKGIKTKKIVTCCPLCYLHLSEASKDKEIIELSEILE